MPSDSEPSTTSKVSLDLVIAVFALLISTTTAIASIYQSRVISSQLSASVWPYLSFTVSLGRSSARLLVTNVGEGPAIVKGARFAIDGSPQKSVAKALAKLLGIALDSSQRRTGARSAAWRRPSNLRYERYRTGSVPQTPSSRPPVSLLLFAVKPVLDNRR
jgi:hypothetical protein